MSELQGEGKVTVQLSEGRFVLLWKGVLLKSHSM